MGLDASVRCRCFEEGRLSEPPVPLEDLYLDADGYLASKTLDAAREKFDYRRFEARYGLLERAFSAWLEHPCAHDHGEYRTSWVSNWSGCHEFEETVEELGGEREFPLLSHLLPKDNGGCYPAEKARPALDELDRLLARLDEADAGPYRTAVRLKGLLQASADTGNPVRWC